LSDAETIGKQLALSTILGVGFNIAGGLLSSAVNVPLIASSLQQDQFLIASVGTIVPEAEAAVAKFVSLQAIAVKKAVTTRIMVSNTPVLPGSCSI
jgi:hypothetical protein